MQQTRQLRDQFGILRCLVLQLVEQLLRPELLQHPFLEERFGGVPQIQIRIQVAPEAFDIEQGLLQQHQLRLNFNVEPARGLEQAHQHQSQGNLLERPVEVRFADGAHGTFELVHPGFGRDPARFNMQFGHALVITPEKCREVLRQVFLVDRSERADDAKVE